MPRPAQQLVLCDCCSHTEHAPLTGTMCLPSPDWGIHLLAFIAYLDWKPLWATPGFLFYACTQRLAPMPLQRWSQQLFSPGCAWPLLSQEPDEPLGKAKAGGVSRTPRCCRQPRGPMQWGCVPRERDTGAKVRSLCPPVRDHMTSYSTKGFA